VERLIVKPFGDGCNPMPGKTCPEDGDAKEFYRRRVVEIKHGRVSMLACTGNSTEVGLFENV